MKRIRTTALLVMVTGFLAVAPALAQTVVYGMAGTFDSLDPNATTFTRTGRITINVVEPLVYEVGPGKYEPGLATSWSVNADATEYTFTLRQGVKFQDGTPFNAEAVKFTFDRIVDPNTKSQTAFSLIGPYKETQIVNDHEVKVVFSKPYAPFLDSAASPYLGIVSPTAYKKAGPDHWGVDTLVGTGPFELKSYAANSEVVLVRNPDYWGGPDFLKASQGNVQELDYKIIAEPSTRDATLESGETNFVEDVAPIDFNSMKNESGIKTSSIPQPGSGWSLMMNEQRSPTDELAVRRAIQLATDKKGMLATIWNNIGTVACGPITHVMFGYDPSMCDLYSHNLDKAKQVLQDAGWVAGSNGMRVARGVKGVADGTPLVIDHYYQAEDNTSQQMAAFMKANLAQVGIDVKLHGLSRSGYFDAVRSGKHNTQNWWETETDPGVVSILFDSKNAGGGTNRNNYINPEMDKLISEAAGAADPQKRAALYSQIQKKVKDEAIMVFYIDPDTLYAQSDKLTGVKMYMDGLYPLFAGATVAK